MFPWPVGRSCRANDRVLILESLILESGPVDAGEFSLVIPLTERRETGNGPGHINSLAGLVMLPKDKDKHWLPQPKNAAFSGDLLPELIWPTVVKRSRAGAVAADVNALLSNY